MNAAWLHITLVHIPVFGTPLLLFMGVKALKSQKTPQLKAFYQGSIILAVFASIAYFTGPSTSDWVKAVFSDYSQDMVENHALWGRFGFTSSILSGLIGIMAISSYLQEEKPHKAIPWVLLGFQLINFLLFVYTAHLGGLIRRPDLL